MEDNSNKKNFIKRSKKKKVTVKETSRIKKIQTNHKRSNSEQAKKITNKSTFEPVSVLNLITKGPSINKLFIKNDNISLKSESMPKENKKMVKKFRSINIDKVKNEIINNIILTNKLVPTQKGSNSNINYMNMDCIEKVHNLRGIAKGFQSNNSMETIKKSKKPNYIIKNFVSNDKLIHFNSNLNRNPIYDFYQPLKEKEIEKEKKKIQKIQSVNQEKRQYRFSDFKVIKDANEDDDDDDESYGHINPDDYREGNNIELISGSSLSEENDVSSSLSSGDEKINKKQNREKNRKKSDKLSNLVNKSFRNKNTDKPERHSNLNYMNSLNSDLEDNYFKNDTKFFMSPKVNSKHPSNKSLKSDAKSDYFNNGLPYFNDSSSNNNDINKNSFLGGTINKSKIKRIESLATNSNNDYEGDLEDDYDLNEITNQYSQFMDSNKLVNNSTINDSFSNIKITDVSQNYMNNGLNNENQTNIQSNKINNNQNENYENIKNNLNNEISNHYSNNNNDNNNIIQNNNINNDFKSQKNNNNEFSLNNFVVNPNQSNIINIHNMNNFNSNNFIFENSGINTNHINSNINNSTNNSINNRYIKSMSGPINNSKIPQNNIFPNSSTLSFNNNNLYNIQSNNRFNDSHFNMNNFIMNKNNQIPAYQLNQLLSQNNLINDNKYLINNLNYFHQNVNDINNNMNNNLNNTINNNFYHSNYYYNINNNNDNQNNKINLNYLNYYNLQNNINNDINNNINNIYQENHQFRYNSERKKNNNYKNLLNQNIININNSNANSNNYINALQYNNNYMNLNNNINPLNNLSMNNPMISSNNINPNLNIIKNNNIIINPNINNNSNNNANLNNNYQIANGIPNINMMINNNINKNLHKSNNFSSNKQKNQNLNLLSNEELAKQAYIIARNQNGCRYLQKRVENNQKLVPTLFFPNILGHIQDLSNDQFGNYYIKILIKYLPEEMIYKLISLIHPSISKIGTNQYGTKVIQYLIEFLTNEKNLLFFIEKTLPHLVTLINDLNGIHIVQRLICIKSNYIELIYNKIFSNIQLIAVTRDGSNFIKRLLEFLDYNNLDLMINSINNNLAEIITNQHGNYIIQNIIMKDNLIHKYGVIENIIKNIVLFSNQKFSSNVVEKCFEVNEMKDKVIEEILKNNNFEQILLNEYGNYVIQKALLKSDQNKQYLMFKLLVPLIPKLQCLSFGQKLLSKLFIQYPKLSIYILNSGD